MLKGKQASKQASNREREVMKPTITAAIATTTKNARS
jgi:hypothetical protein